MNAPDPAAVAPPPDNPFIGVRPYPEGRTLYGREHESAELADLLISRRIVLLYSPSGAGKTSLMNTALRRDLTLRGKGRFRVSKALRVGYLSEAPAPNRYVLSALHYLEKSFPDAEQLPDGTLALYTLPRYLAERWTPAMQSADARSRRDVLVFDQFEELFTLDPTDLDAKRAFLAQVAEALGDRDDGEESDALRAPLRWAVFAMREDFIAELDPYKGALPTALSTRFRLNLLGREAAKRVILCTAADAGAEFGEEAIANIVDDLARVRAPRGAPGEWVDGPFVEPVQLQVVCRRLWSRHMREGKRHLRPEDLAATADTSDDARALGAVDDALAQFYADCAQEAAGGSTTRERAIRDWIEHSLVSKAKLRSQVMLDPGSPLPIDESAMRALGGTLLRKETRGGREWIELTHDRLIEPLLYDNNRWRGEHLSLLQMQAYLWAAAGRADGFLLNGAALEQAAAWAETHDHELSDVDREFLAAALKARDQRRNVKRNRLLVNLVVGILALTALVSGAWYKTQLHNVELDAEKKEAERQRDEAGRQSRMSGIRFDLSEADVLRTRDLIGSIRAALTSAGQLDELAAAGGDPAELPPERITIEASLLDAMRRAPPVLVRYAGHGKAVRRALFVPGGRIVSAGYDGALRLWSAADGRPIADRGGDGRALFAAEFEPRRSLVADGDGAERIRLWKLGDASLDPLAVIEPEAGRTPSRITALAFIADGAVLVASTWDRRLMFFDVSRPEAPKRFATLEASVHSMVVYSLAASADGRMLATGSWDGSVAVWHDLPTPREPNRTPRVERLDTDPKADRAAINAVAFSHSGRYLAAGGHEGSVFLWETGPGMAKSFRRLRGDGGHEGTVFGVAFDADEATLASVAIDRRVVLWRVAEARNWKPDTPLPLGEPFPPLPERLYGVAFDPTRAQTLALAAGPSVFIVDLDRPVSPLAERLQSADGQTGSWSRPWQAIAITADASMVAASRDGRVNFWTPRSGGRYQPRTDDRIGQSDLTRLAMDGEGGVVLTGGRNGAVYAWRDGRNEATPLLPPSDKRVIALAVSRDGRTAAASLGAELVVWRLGADGKVSVLARQTLAAQRIRALAFDSKGTRLAAGASDGSVHLWSVLPDGIRTDGASRAVQPSEINVIAFTPDDARLATGAEDSTIAIWTLPQLEFEREFTEHRSGVVSLAFCSVGGDARLFSSDRDGEVIARLSLADQRHTRTLMHSFGRPRYLAVTPDCRRVVTSGATALAWNVEGGFIRGEACQLADAGATQFPACGAPRTAASARVSSK